jgi:uracil-DNA glycosylase family 4
MGIPVEAQVICGGCEAQMERGFRYVENDPAGRQARFLLVGEAPGQTEDERMLPFVGKTGRVLRRALREIGVRDKDYALTNAVRVRPGTGNPDPRMNWIRQCRAVCLAQTLEEVQPELIVCLGRTPLKSFTDDADVKLMVNRHKTFWYEYSPEPWDSTLVRRIPVVATWHPSYVLRVPDAYDWWINDLEMYLLRDSWRRTFLESNYRQLERLTPAARRSSAFTVDVETTGFHPWAGDTLRCVGVRPQGSVTSVLTPPDGGESTLRDLCMDDEVVLRGWNLQFDLMWGVKPGELPRCSVEDGMYLHYLLDERYPVRGLKHQARLYTPYEPVDLPRGGVDHPLEQVVPYCADDVALTDLTTDGILEELSLTGTQYERCAKLYGRAIPILAGMTRTGIPVDREVLAHAREMEEAKVETALDNLRRIWEMERPLLAEDCPKCDGAGTVELEFYTLSLPEQAVDEEAASLGCSTCSGEGYWWREVEWDPSVLNRPHDLSDFIFGTLGLEVPRMQGSHRKDGRPSTARVVLETIVGEDESGFVQGVFDYRDHADNLNKYVLDVEERLGSDSRVRPSFNIVTRQDRPRPEGTTSGRMSVSRPGLHSTPTGHPMRRAFVPLPGHTHLIQVDRAQAELSDLAQFSGDKTLRRLINERIDQHSRMADLATEAGYPVSRQQAKTINFGILYGIGPSGLERNTGFDQRAGRRFIDLWFEEYPDVYTTRREIHYLALKRGYVDTAYGRRRHFPLGLVPRSNEGSKAQRRAFNFIIQATANDLNMVFLVEWCNRRLEELAFPIFCIHDAVLFSTDKPEETLRVMEEGYRTWYADAVEKFLDEDLEVVLRADAKVGVNWGEMVGEDDEGNNYWWFSTHEDEGHIDLKAIPNESTLQ